MENKIRAFIALELSDEARDELSRITGVLKDANADVKWVRPASVHLTLKFLGNIPEEKVQAIAARLKKIADTVPPFKIELDGIGVFPGWNRVRVLWIGVRDPGAHAEDLAAGMEEAMTGEGFEKEKRSFRSHLTIGRVRTAKNKDKLKDLVTSVTVKPAQSHISRIVLFRSNLTPTGAVYEPLAAPDLTGK